MKPPFAAAVRRFWPIGLLLGLVVLFFWESFFAHKVLCLRDPFYLLFNFPQFVSKILETPEFFPLWNPFVGHGKPLLADPEFAFFYPVHWIYYLLSPSKGMVFSYSFCVFASGAFTYALARHWKFSVFPALCAAVSLMFSTWVIAMLEFRAHIAVFSWGPLELLIISVLLERFRNAPTAGVLKNIWIVIGLAGVMSMQYLAGYPQMFLFNQMLVGLFVVMRCLWLREWKMLLPIGVSLAIAGAITAGVCMAQFLASWEFIQQSERSVMVDPGLDMASFHPRQLFTLFVPYLYGRLGYPMEYWGISTFEFWAGTCYVGLFPLVAATFSPFCLKRFTGKKENELHRFLFWFFCGLAGLALLLSAGKYTPFYMALYHYVPGFSHFRWPSKFLVFLLYALSFLGALGAQNLWNWARAGLARPGSALWVLWAWCIVFACAGLGYLFADPALFSLLTGGRYISTAQHDATTLSDFGRMVLFLAGAVGVAALFFGKYCKAQYAAIAAVSLCFVNLWFVSREIQPIMDDDIYQLHPQTLHAPFEPLQPWQVLSTNQNAGQFFYGSRDKELYQWGVDAAINNVLQRYAIFQEHSIGIELSRYQMVSRLLQQLPSVQQNRLADLMNIRYVVLSDRIENVIQSKAARRVGISERPTALPKAYVVDRWRAAPGLEQSVLAMLSDGFDPRHEVSLELQPGQSAPSLPISPDFEPSGEVRRLHYQWNSVDLNVSTKRAALLVLTDTWFPGWKATVNGREVPIYLANGLFRAVPLPAGASEVVFRYEPKPFAIGIWITLMTVGLLAIAGSLRLAGYFCRNRKL